MEANAGRWTNPSVLRFAAGADPVLAIIRRARSVVAEALDDGWSGPPYDPIELARRLGVRVAGSDDVHDARTVADDDGRLRIEFNPSRPRARIRYSIAHELAHTLFPDCAEHVRNRAAYHELTRDEWQLEAMCNIAAAEFVMPLGSFEELRSESLGIDDLLALRTRLEVSMEALLLRVVRLATAPVAMFCSSRIESGAGRGRVRLDYAIGSSTWRRVPPRGLVLPADSVVQGCSAIGYTAKGAETWASFDVAVECVGIPPYPGSTWPRVVGLLRHPGAPAEDRSGISYLRGDALEPRGQETAIVAHVVNDATPNWGGRGFAQAVRSRLPDVQDDFRNWVSMNRRNLRLGSSRLCSAGPSMYVLSMVCQEGYGPSSTPRLRYAALQTCLVRLADAASELGASVHMPRIGTGHAGGSWEVIEELIEQEVCDRGIAVTVYDLPEPMSRPSRATG